MRIEVKRITMFYELTLIVWIVSYEKLHPVAQENDSVH